MAKFILGAALALVLAGCGGGGGDASSRPPAQASCTPRTATVALVGDSTMWGVLIVSGTQAPDNPGTRLQHDMDLQFGPGAVVVTDYGVQGTVAAQAPHVVADVIVANYGINDAHLGVSIADYKAAMLAVGATLIETANPVFGTTYGAFDVGPYVAAAESLGLPIADTNAYVQTLPGWQAMLPDGVHPDDLLYLDITDNVLAPAVAAQVAPLRCVRS